MRFASYSEGNGNRLAVEAGDGMLLDLAEAVTAAEGRQAEPYFCDANMLIEAGAGALERARNALAHENVRSPGLRRLSPDGISWLAPVLRPSKIVCVALNNSANSERIMSGPKHPALFVKASNALAGHMEPIRLRESDGRVHPEPELAVIIGKTARDISPDNAYDHVYGYTIHNDITSPSMRGEDTFHYRAVHPGSDEADINYVDTFVTYPGRYKCSDTFSPMGPWLVTRDEIADPHALSVILKRGDQLITQDSTQNLTNKIPAVVSFVSSYITLLPGDIVSMGTALKRTDQKTVAVQNIDLQKTSEPISVTIEGLGTLTSTVKRI